MAVVSVRDALRPFGMRRAEASQGEGCALQHALTGIHHVSALTADAGRNAGFYTRALGLRLVKRSVNQDDPHTYHLFYADRRGSPGSDLTFFAIPHLAREEPGSGSISRVGLRVASEASLAYWRERLAAAGAAVGEIARLGAWQAMPFVGFEGQPICLVADAGQARPAGEPWTGGGVPAEHAIMGLGPLVLTVRALGPTAAFLTGVLGFRHVASYPSLAAQGTAQVFATGEGGAATEIHVEERANLPHERLGRGGVHHLALRVPDDDALEWWLRRIEAAHLRTSGIVDRYYFHSVYVRERGGILFELATDGPGFLLDEPEESLGERLSLPPFLEPRRAEIEQHLPAFQLKD